MVARQAHNLEVVGSNPSPAIVEEAQGFFSKTPNSDGGNFHSGWGCPWSFGKIFDNHGATWFRRGDVAEHLLSAVDREAALKFDQDLIVNETLPVAA